MKLSQMLAATAVLAMSALAREELLVKEDPVELEHSRPRVDLTSTEKCVVDLDQLEVCFTFGAALKLGWDWEQEASYPSDTEGLTEGTYTFDLVIYSEQEGEVDLKLFLDRLFSLKPVVTLEKFKAKFDLGMNYFYDTQRLCMYSYLSIADFSFSTKMRMALITWKKNIIETLWSYENWSSRDALIFDDISLSSEEQITLYETSVSALEEDFYIYGTTLNQDTSCIPGVLVLPGDSAGFYNYVNQATQNLIDYAGTKPKTGAGVLVDYNSLQ